LKNYYITGEFHVDVKYTNGGRDRLEKEYYKSGKIKSEQQYKDDKLIDMKEYDEEGNLIHEMKDGVILLQKDTGI